VNVPRFIRRWFRAPYDGLRHYGVVEEGVLYRSGQPTPEQLGTLIERHRLKTVIALRGSRDPQDPDAWEQVERQVCRERNVDFVTLPCNHKNPPTAQQLRRFLDLMRDRSRHPALIHCRIGQQRTGMFCALYRVHIQGMDADEALQEMNALGFNVRRRRHQRLLQAYREFAQASLIESSADLSGSGAGATDMPRSASASASPPREPPSSRARSPRR
jgi:tyrosine-protein phosphatase SIW14